MSPRASATSGAPSQHCARKPGSPRSNSPGASGSTRRTCPKSSVDDVACAGTPSCGSSRGLTRPCISSPTSWRPKTDGQQTGRRHRAIDWRIGTPAGRTPDVLSDPSTGSPPCFRLMSIYGLFNASAAEECRRLASTNSREGLPLPRDDKCPATQESPNWRTHRKNPKDKLFIKGSCLVRFRASAHRRDRRADLTDPRDREVGAGEPPSQRSARLPTMERFKEEWRDLENAFSHRRSRGVMPPSAVGDHAAGQPAHGRAVAIYRHSETPARVKRTAVRAP
jgi:hypothetical protein